MSVQLKGDERQVTNAPMSDEDEPINFIIQESVVGGTESRASASTSTTVRIAGSVDLPMIHWQSITFTPDDAEGVTYLHCDALVVMVKVSNRIVKRVLIYHGSSTDIIHWAVVEQLRYRIEQLQPARYYIRGIGGHQTKPLGQIDLPVCFGSRPKTRSLWVTFQVIDIPFPFNMLIGRPTIYDMRAVSSVYCMKVNFPTENGEGEMKADQSEYRRCVEIGQNTLTTVGGLLVTTVDRTTRLRSRKLRKRRTLNVLIQQ
ncbi:hypothetical protein ACOSP7_031657 [Xanthoceras sorbifolium]